MAKLVCVAGPYAGREMEIGDSEFTIGRRQEDNFYLDDPAVARKQAKIVRRADGYYLVELGGTDNVRLNGNTVKAASLLHNRDVVEICNHSFRIEDIPGPESTDLAPAIAHERVSGTGERTPTISIATPLLTVVVAGVLVAGFFMALTHETPISSSAPAELEVIKTGKYGSLAWNSSDPLPVGEQEKKNLSREMLWIQADRYFRSGMRKITERDVTLTNAYYGIRDLQTALGYLIELPLVAAESPPFYRFDAEAAIARAVTHIENEIATRKQKAIMAIHRRDKDSAKRYLHEIQALLPEEKTEHFEWARKELYRLGIRR